MHLYPDKLSVGYVRVSYAYSINHLVEAIKRIREFLAELSDSGEEKNPQ